MYPEIINIVFILTEDQYSKIITFLEQNNNGIYGTITGEYNIRRKDSGYKSVQIEFIAYGVSSEGLIAYLSNHLSYICMRAECSPYIFVKNTGDLNDLKEDCYAYNNSHLEFKKDLLTIQERHDLLYESEEYIDFWSQLSLHTTQANGINCKVPLNENTKELYNDEGMLIIEKEDTGEILKIDLCELIPEHYFSFILPKNLEKDYKNLL